MFRHHRSAPRAAGFAALVAGLVAAPAAFADSSTGLPSPTGLQAQAVAAHGDGAIDDIRLQWHGYTGFPAECTNNREIRVLREDVEDVHHAAAPDATGFLDADLAEGTYVYALQARCRVPAVPGRNGSPAINLFSEPSPAVLATISNAPPCAGAPAVAASATPTSLWPPNGKLVNVNVTGTVTPQQNCTMPEYVSFAIFDEYGEFDTALAAVALVNGTFSFSVPLEASRHGEDRDGRQYGIGLATPDGGMHDFDVVVPHDQRKK